MKLHLSAPSVSHHVLSNFWIPFLLVVFTISLKPTTCSVDSKLVFAKVGAVRIRSLIVQAIEDDFQQRPVQHSVLTLLDFSKAYNTVWRENCSFMLNTGIPSTFICLSSMTAEHVFNSLLSLVPIICLSKLYLKVLFLHHCSSCFASTI